MKERFTLRLIAKDFQGNSCDSLTDSPIARAYRRQVENKNKKYKNIYELIEVRRPVLVLKEGANGYAYYLIHKSKEYAAACREYQEKAMSLRPGSIAKICEVEIDIPSKPSL